MSGGDGKRRGSTIPIFQATIFRSFEPRRGSIEFSTVPLSPIPANGFTVPDLYRGEIKKATRIVTVRVFVYNLRSSLPEYTDMSFGSPTYIHMYVYLCSSSFSNRFIFVFCTRLSTLDSCCDAYLSLASFQLLL